MGSGAHILVHSILKIERQIWYEGRPPNLSTSMLSPVKLFFPWVLPGERTCAPFAEGTLHLWMGGGGGALPPFGWGVEREGSKNCAR